MSMLCIPLPSADKFGEAARLNPHLIEVPQPGRKILSDPFGAIQLVDYDWKAEIPDVPNLIFSYHNYEETPLDLEELLQRMRAKHKARFYKIATLARSTLDALRMLEFSQKHPDVIGVCMGDEGQPTRILAPIFGTPIIYAALSSDYKTAPGQLTLEELETTYHIRKLRPSTPIFAVIGDPVAQSPGPVYHNARLQGNGVYLRLRVTPEELSPFFSYVRRFPFRGISVTIPHKVAVLPFLDAIDPEAEAIGAVNTIDIRDGRLTGYNTDGAGAALALGDVAGKKVVVLGAGGAAQAIIYALLQRGAHVTILNRTREKAEELARRFQCKAGGEEAVYEPYDIIIQATGSNSFPPIQEGKTAMEVRLHDTLFLQYAKLARCHIVTGYEMYTHQAEMQREIWS